MIINLWLKKTRIIEVSVLVLITTSPAKAQIIPDATLPNNSNVTTDGSTDIITEGTTAGNNLFHSFDQFSIPTGSAAYFNNSLDIQNIISRVTGSSVSNINGLIKANGTANLFFLNPNGIIFGPNASLNIGGSFLGTSASYISFANGSQFSAAAPHKPLLKVSVPVGLGFGSNPGDILVQGTGHVLEDPIFFPITGRNSSTGLRVQPNQTLALVGGNIALQGGILTAEGGRVELGSVSDGLVSLSPTSSGWNLGYQNVPFFKDIQMSQQALVDASGIGSGSIGVQGKTVSLQDGSVILIQNQGSQHSGNIHVNASESLELSGTYPQAKIASTIMTETVGSGEGGDTTVSTKRVVLQNGGEISARAFSTGIGGSLTLNTSEFVQIIGFSKFNNLRRFSNVGAVTHDSGNAGNIVVSTRHLAVLQGGSVGSATFGDGKGGNIDISAESIELIGVIP